VRRRFGGRKSFLFNGSFIPGILRYSGTRSQKICVGKARSALKAAAKFSEAVRAGGVTALRMNAF